MKLVLIVCLMGVSFLAKAQEVSDFIAATNLDSLEKIVREFSGEESCRVNGVGVTLLNRVSNSPAGNNLAADYILQRLNSYGLVTEVDNYSANGRNIYAQKMGVINPDSIVIIGAHYDAVANYCADDNGSGVAIALEAARLLSQSNFENTILFAFWDEEEIGLIGSKKHAQQLNAAQTKIKAVLNIDMAAYDSNDDRVFDIDLNVDSGSEKIKDALLRVKNDNHLNLFERVVQPGTDASDHSAFWTYGYPAVLLGESWETNDQNSEYHTSNDRISLFNMPYFHSIAKLAIGYLSDAAIPMTAVSVRNNFLQKSVGVYPNPVSSLLSIKTADLSTISVYDASGKLLKVVYGSKGVAVIDVSNYSKGIYSVAIYSISNRKLFQQRIVVN